MWDEKTKELYAALLYLSECVRANEGVNVEYYAGGANIDRMIDLIKEAEVARSLVDAMDAADVAHAEKHRVKPGYLRNIKNRQTRKA